MQSVKVRKDTLLTTVQQNRDEHIAAYNIAIAGYWVKLLEVYDGLRTRIIEKKLDGDKVYKELCARHSMPKPESHKTEYDRAIEMLELHQEDLVALTAQEFDQYVKDDWGWKKDFMATASNYNN